MSDRDGEMPSSTEEGSAPYDRTDDGLRVLLQVRDRIAPDLSRDLLERCYAIQKKHQFDLERERPLDLTRGAVEAFIGQETHSTEEGGE